jgi:hypothetical protein
MITASHIKGRVVLGRCRDFDADIVASLARFGIDELTRPYDKDEIAKIMAHVTLGIGKKSEIESPSAQSSSTSVSLMRVGSSTTTNMDS